MAKFKAIKNAGSYAPLNTIVDGQLVFNDRDPNWKASFSYTSDLTKAKGSLISNYTAKDINQFLEYFEPIDDAAKKMVSDFKEGKAPTSVTIAPPESLGNFMSNVQVLSKRVQILSPIGLAAGLGFAYYKKSSVKGYIGYGILFSLVGTIIAVASMKVVPPKK